MKLISKNQNPLERITRFIISIFLIPSLLIYDISIFSIIQSIVGFVLFFNAIVGICAIYKIFGISTCKV